MSPYQKCGTGRHSCLWDDGTIPTNWPLARVIQTHPRSDTLIRVVTEKTANGMYRRPVSEIAILIPSDSVWTQLNLNTCIIFTSLVYWVVSHYTHNCSYFSLLYHCKTVWSWSAVRQILGLIKIVNLMCALPYVICKFFHVFRTIKFEYCEWLQTS